MKNIHIVLDNETHKKLKIKAIKLNFKFKDYIDVILKSEAAKDDKSA